MMRVAVVEDEERAAKKLHDYFEKFAAEEGVAASLTRFENAESFLRQYQNNYDLVMMDIQMPGINGMEAAQKLRKLDPEVILVFVTNMAQYAIKGYEVDALDFVVKPLKYQDFVFKMRRVLRALALRTQPQITLATSDGLRRMNLSGLQYVEVTGHRLIYHFINEDIVIRGTMSKVEEELKPHHFMKCNNCYLVNPKHIVEVKGYTVVVGLHELSISHPRKKMFLQELNEWIAGGGR